MSRNDELFEAAQRVLPGGVSSPVRAYGAVGGTPPTIVSGSGAFVRDADDRELLDMVCAWGAQIVGHAHPRVVKALQARAAAGTVFGAPCEEETQLAERIVGAVPSVERVRFVSSGTEACMSALRLARAVTGRDLTVKFSGCYHGHADALLSSAGSGALTFGTPDSPGVPESWAATTLTASYNDLDSVRALFAEHGERIAAVIVEPVVGNMGCVPPDDGFLAGLRDVTTEHGALLVLDEVMTGFRVAWGGAQIRYDVRPDLTCFAKVIGGGMPVGAYAGPAALMDQLAPAGPVYQAGTLSGNPIGMAAGIATLDILAEDGAYDRLERTGAAIQEVLQSAARTAGVDVRVQRVGAMLTVFFGDADTPVRSLADSKARDAERFRRWHAALLANRVLWPPSSFEAAFISLAHDARALETLARASSQAFEAAAG